MIAKNFAPYGQRSASLRCSKRYNHASLSLPFQLHLPVAIMNTKNSLLPTDGMNYADYIDALEMASLEACLRREPVGPLAARARRQPVTAPVAEHGRGTEGLPEAVGA